MDWNLFDYIVAFALISIFGLAFWVAMRKVTSTKLRIAIGIGILLLFVLVWGELAVGLFGTPWSGS